MDQRDDLSFDAENTADRVSKRLAVTVLPPLQFTVERTGSLLRFTVTDRGRFGSGATHYAFYFAADVDTSTKAGTDAGFTRATKLGCDVQRAFLEGKDISTELTDPKFGSGYFYCVGANDLGDISDYLLSAKQSSEILDDTLPDNVTSLAFSEGGEQANGTVVSAVAFSYYAPLSASFYGVQWFLENYPNVGQVTEYLTHRYAGEPGGFASDKFFVVPARRPGVGTVSLITGTTGVTGIGTRFGSQFVAGDLVEVLGVQATVQFVGGDTVMVLAANWTGKTGTFADYLAIGNVTIYAVPLSKAQTHGDYRKAASGMVLLDADLSTPLAPALAGFAAGNTNRLVVTPPAGTGIDIVTLYRAKGTAIAFGDPTMRVLMTWRRDNANPAAFGNLQFDDTDFLVYDREQQQVWSYYATATNVRGKEGPPSPRVELACRLDSSADNNPTVPARDVSARNLLWNAQLFFNADATIDVTSAVQDTAMGGGAPPPGFGRVDHEESGGSTPAAFMGSTALSYVKLASPGAGKLTAMRWKVGGWDAVAGSQRVPLGAYLVLQFKAVASGGAPDGILCADIAQFNGGAFQGFAGVRVRLSNDVIDETGTLLSYNSTELFSTGRLYWGVFKLDPAKTTDEIRIRIMRQDGVSAAFLMVTMPMLSIGEGLTAWTAEMVDKNITYPRGGGPSFPPGLDGGGTFDKIPIAP